MSKKANNIIDIIDPDKYQCTECKAYKDDDGFSHILMANNSKMTTRVCSECWDNGMPKSIIPTEEEISKHPSGTPFQNLMQRIFGG